MTHSATTISFSEWHKLPLYARIAFVARCAGRLQPLYSHYCPELPEKYTSAVEKAISLLENITAECDVDIPRCAAYTTAAKLAAGAAKPDSPAAAVATIAVAGLRLAGNPFSQAELAGFLEFLLQTIQKAVQPIGAQAWTWKAMYRDLTLLKELSRYLQWTDDTPVSVKMLGPLWPEGEPEGWPIHEDASAMSELIFDLEVPEGVSEQEVLERVRELYELANDLHKSFGGSGLTIKELTITSEAPNSVEVES